MTTGAITANIDVAQVTLYAFWVFFAGLVYYMLKENKREGFSIDTTEPGWPPLPAPKTYLLGDGTTVTAPRIERTTQNLNAAPMHGFPGAPLEPTGANPLLDGVGPGSWADRANIPDVNAEGELRIVPLRTVPDFGVAHQDTDPRGLDVLGADGEVAGTVTDLWVDRSDVLFRYLEVQLSSGAKVLLPVAFTRIGQRAIRVNAILASQFAHVPAIAQPDRITRLEEEKIVAYFGAGTLYATPSRQEPLL